MATQALEGQEQEVTAEVDAAKLADTTAQDEAAFNAGFDDGEQTTTPDTTTVEAGAEPEPTPKEPEPPKLAQITEEQFQSLMKAASDVDEIRRDSKSKIDALSGHIGGLKQKLEQLQQGRSKMTPGQLKRVNAEFPELGKLLEEDLGETFTGGSQIDPEEIDKKVQARVAEQVVPLQKTILHLYHRDWNEVVTSKDFMDWQKTLPADEEQKFLASNDGAYIAGVITSFKDFKAKQATPTQTPPKPDGANRQRLLAAAAQPKGTGGHATGPTAEDEFMAGFTSG